MKFSDFVSLLADSKSRRTCICSLLTKASLLCLVLFIGVVFIATDVKESLPRWPAVNSLQNTPSTTCEDKGKPNGTDALPKGIVSKTSNFEMRPLWGLPPKKNQCEHYGNDPLPKGIVSKTSNFEMRPLWGFPKKKKNAENLMNLLAIAVGIKQKDNVNEMVKKFPSSDFVLMLFHYDGFVDEWSDLEWSNRAIHVSAINQTKWWFAKRFLHPDIVDAYNYIFLWDEDLGVEDFNPLRYLSIVKDEGLEISQPALDIAKSEVHHQITARGRRSKVHRRIYKSGGGHKCDDTSTGPPCTGWVEMMAPVFSRAAWRCAWYMVQNDLIHAWGLDKKLGYCAQGDRTKTVGVVDSEYIVHKGFPTLGGFNEKEAAPVSHGYNDRYMVRRQSFIEFEIFRKRWNEAIEEDKCWVDPYPRDGQGK